MKKYILRAKRTPIGKFLGSYYECTPLDVCRQLLTETFNGLDKTDADIAVFGNAISAGMGQGFDRAVCLSSGFPIEMPSYSVNMVCGSGARAIINACEEIELGARLCAAGGYEFMSNIPFATNSYLRLGKKFGSFEMVDLMQKDGLWDSLNGEHMGITAERIAERYGISREAQDEFALRSQTLAVAAIDEGRFNDEIVPINLLDYRKRPFIISQDEFPRRDTSLEKLAQLKPTFIKDGTLTAGNVSGINDGACFLAIASEEYISTKNFTPLAEIVGHASVGCDHEVMGLGPYFAISKLLKDNSLSTKDISFFEINEAFAAQLLGDVRLLSKEFGESENALIERINVRGSGIALGHPLGCSGARITTTLTYILQSMTRPGSYGIASLCIGGGQGIAILLRRP